MMLETGRDRSIQVETGRAMLGLCYCIPISIFISLTVNKSSMLSSKQMSYNLGESFQLSLVEGVATIINSTNFTAQCFLKFCNMLLLVAFEVATNASKMQLLIKAMKCRGEKLTDSAKEKWPGVFQLAFLQRGLPQVFPV